MTTGRIRDKRLAESCERASPSSSSVIRDTGTINTTKFTTMHRSSRILSETQEEAPMRVQIALAVLLMACESAEDGTNGTALHREAVRLR
jgi:hypothetical protein